MTPAERGIARTKVRLLFGQGKKRREIAKEIDVTYQFVCDAIPRGVKRGGKG